MSNWWEYSMWEIQTKLQFSGVFPKSSCSPARKNPFQHPGPKRIAWPLLFFGVPRMSNRSFLSGWASCFIDDNKMFYARSVIQQTLVSSGGYPSKCFVVQKNSTVMRQFKTNLSDLVNQREFQASGSWVISEQGWWWAQRRFGICWILLVYFCLGIRDLRVRNCSIICFKPTLRYGLASSISHTIFDLEGCSLRWWTVD